MRNVIIWFLRDGLVCGFWCFVWHKWTHPRKPKAKLPLRISNDPDATLGCICAPGEIVLLGSPDPLCGAHVHRN